MSLFPFANTVCVLSSRHTPCAVYKLLRQIEGCGTWKVPATLQSECHWARATGTGLPLLRSDSTSCPNVTTLPLTRSWHPVKTVVYRSILENNAPHIRIRFPAGLPLAFCLTSRDTAQSPGLTLSATPNRFGVSLTESSSCRMSWLSDKTACPGISDHIYAAVSPMRRAACR